MPPTPPATPPLFSSAVIAHGLLLIGATAAIALAGFASQGDLGVFLLFAGAALLCCRPLAPVERRWWVGGGVLIGGCSLALLPARMLPSDAPWRHAVATIPVIGLPGTISPAPQATVFWLLILVLTVVTGLFVLSQPLRSGALVYLVLLAVLICGVYAALSIGAKLADWRPPLVSGPAFGFFPNRNHTATFLVTGSVLALSLLNVAFLARRWVIVDLALGALALCLVALFGFSGSRAGIVFPILGAAIWGTGFWVKHRDRRLFAGQGVIAVLAVGCLLAFQGPARDRLLVSVGFQPPPHATPAPTPTALIPNETPREQGSELRLPIWRDTLHMIGDAPWTGTGLGTFSWVFPQYRQLSITGVQVLHPESDWLMFIAEAGWPAFACVVVLGLGLAGRLVAGRQHPYWPLRWGCAAAVLTALLHAALDVPTHRASLGWWLLVLAGWSLSLTRTDPGTPARPRQRPLPSARGWQRAVFMLAGVGALTMGGLLTAAEWFGGPDLPPFLMERAPFKIFGLYQRKQYAAAEALARRVIHIAPLFDQPYFHLGVTLASQSDDRRTDAKVDDLFRAQRFLDPDAPSVPRAQENTWAGYDPVRQAAMALDGIARQARIDRSIGVDPQHAIDEFGDVVSGLRAQPDVQRLMLGAMRPDVRFGRVWLKNVASELARDEETHISADETFLRGLSDSDRRLVQPDWFLRRTPDETPSLLPGGRGAAVQGWPVRLRQMVDRGRFERAVNALARRYGVSLELPPDTDITVPTKEGRQTVRVSRSWTGQDFDRTRQLLQGAVMDTNQSEDWEVVRWRAAFAAHAADWPAAWLDLENYVHSTRQTEWP